MTIRTPTRKVRMTRGKWAVDIGIALVLIVMGLVEVWLPMESLMGDGSPVVSTLGLLVFNTLLTQRRARPWFALSGLLVWPVLGFSQGGILQAMFFGQLVPVMVLVFSIARFAQGPLRWIGPLGGIAFVTLADLFMPLLREPFELIFHWGNIILAFLLGLGLRISAERASAEAVRATLAESTAREQALLAVSEERARIAREALEIVVTDPGPARGSGSGGSGHGLVGMRERVALFGGRVSTEVAGDGFEVRAVLPLERVG